jgi:hypothetical protein
MDKGFICKWFSSTNYPPSRISPIRTGCYGVYSFINIAAQHCAEPWRNITSVTSDEDSSISYLIRLVSIAALLRRYSPSHHLRLRLLSRVPIPTLSPPRARAFALRWSFAESFISLVRPNHIFYLCSQLVRLFLLPPRPQQALYCNHTVNGPWD